MERFGIIRHFLQRRDGNLALVAAIILPVSLGAAGMAVDIGRAMQVKSDLQIAADAAAIATASAMANKDMTDAEAEAFAREYFVSQVAHIDPSKVETPEERTARLARLTASLTTKAKTSSSSGMAQTFDVSVSLTTGVPLSGLGNVLGMSALNVTVTSVSASGREGNALSMYLALDESGSMAYDTTTVNEANPKKLERTVCGRKACFKEVTNYISKMASLKVAAAAMFSEVKKADPKQQLIRMGASSYDDQTMPEQPVAWGPSAVAHYVTALPDVPAGGTDAVGAMTNALNALHSANSNEKTEHAKKNNKAFGRFIVLMTDGEMTGESNKWNARLDGDVRALCKKAKDDGIKVYTIAFMAPERGREMLNDCASGAEFYYEPESMPTLVKTFGDIARKATSTGTLLRS